MIVLGVAFLSDASACIVRDGELVAAVSEERLNRIKLWHGVPYQAIRTVLEMAGLSLEDVDCIATHGRAPSAPDRAEYDRKASRIAAAHLAPDVEARQLAALWSRFEHESMVLGKRTPGYLAELQALGRPLRIYGHHQAHAACAYYGSGWDDAAVVTADGWGEDGSHSLSHGTHGSLTLQARSATFDSLGYFYGSVTKALGFVPHRHEGKVLGLAAHCTEPASYPQLQGMVELDPASNTFVGGLENGLYVPRFENPALADLAARFPREDVAAAAQRRLEEVMTGHISALGSAAARVAVAGGIFANVKLNQRIAELENVDEIFVFPNMGDGGLSLGAAWLAHVDMTGERPQPLRTCYLGPEPTDAEMLSALRDAGLQHRRSADIHRDIAEYLAAGHVVARCTGRMEFGPRALGHRSLLYQADDPAVNRWLNTQLGRSEFMPFAPASLEADAGNLYHGLDKCAVSAHYMTITCDCTEYARALAPAAVHVDGTARPQIVTRQDHPDLHAILQAYHDRTGRSTVINTSFNMHEEPIVCTAADAVRAFVAGGLGVLALGDYVIESANARLHANAERHVGQTV